MERCPADRRDIAVDSKPLGEGMYPFRFGRRFGHLAPYVIMLPALAVFAVFHLLPSIATILFSFTNITRTGYKAVEFIGLSNYLEFFNPALFTDKAVALRNSFVFAFFVVLIQNGLALLFAVILNRGWKTRNLFRALIFLPVILGVTVNALIWKLMFNPFGGPVNTLVRSLTGANLLFFADPKMAFGLIIFLQIWTYVGYSTVIFVAGLQGIPAELYESATVDGAGRWVQFRAVTVPLIAQAITVNVLLAIIGALRTFDTIYVTTNGQNYTYTMAFYMFRLAFLSEGGSGRSEGRLGFASAVATLLFLMILVVAVVVQGILRKREVET
jgi:raffinose/stachyose/melibiose transport system permease protein